MEDNNDSILTDLMGDFCEIIKKEITPQKMKNVIEPIILFLQDYLKIYLYLIYVLIVILLILNVIILTLVLTK